MHTNAVNAVPYFLPSLQDITNDAALYVGVKETAFTKSAVSSMLFHLQQSGCTRLMRLELLIMIEYTNMPIVGAVCLY